MTMLILDTATERGVVGFMHNQKLLFCSELPFGLQNSQKLLPEIEHALQKHQLNVTQFSAIVVGVGPGSYTGMRVAATVAKTLSFACQVPLIAISTLNAFIPETSGLFAAVIDAKVGGIYIQKGLRKNEKIDLLDQRLLLPIEEAVLYLKDIPLLVTPNATHLKPKLEQYGKNFSWLWQTSSPSAQHMGQLGQKKLDMGDIVTGGKMELFYMRKTQAEIEASLKN